MSRRWKWRVRGYYGPAAQPPKREGDLALEVLCADDHTRDVEVSVFNGRADIGRVEVSEA